VKHCNEHQHLNDQTTHEQKNYAKLLGTSTQNFTNTASECSKTRRNKTTSQLQSACTWHYIMSDKKGSHHTFKPNLLYTKRFSNVYHRQTQQ